MNRCPTDRPRSSSLQEKSEIHCQPRILEAVELVASSDEDRLREVILHGVAASMGLEVPGDDGA